MSRRLAYVLKRFPRISETFVAAELIELERQGETVTVFALGRPKEPFQHAFLDELTARVVYLPYRPLREPLRVAGALWRVLLAERRGWLCAARLSLRPPRLIVGVRRLLQATVLRDELGRAQIDHAHAHFATAAARLTHLSRLMGGVTYSVTAHAKDIYHEVRPERLREKLVPASFVATVSTANQRHLDAVMGGGTRSLLVPNSIDLHRVRAAGERRPEPDLVVSAARLVEKKGLADLVDACALLHGRDVRLELAGAGPLRAELEAQARRLGATVRFHGALRHEDVLQLLCRASVFVLPCLVTASGDRDGLPTSVLEAMAIGVPVVTTAVNGLADAVLHEQTGLVVAQRDPEALAAAIVRLLDDRELAERLGREGRRAVERSFSLERSTALLRSLFPGTT